MRETIGKLITIIGLLFYLPAIIFLAIINFLQSKISGKPFSKDKKYSTSIMTFVSLVVWVGVLGYVIYQEQFETEYYVYACPVERSTSKCYKLKADYIPKDCLDPEWGEGGSYQGTCGDPSIGRIYFENGGSLSFDYCTHHKNGKWTCHTQEERWEIQFAENVRVRRQ